MFSDSPISTLRERNVTTGRESLGHSSPTSTLSGSPPAPGSTSIARLAREASRTSLRGVLTPAGTPSRKPVVRADPSILTCFDPSDKELYDLWAPKK
ncbi:hypothetical protein K435DRAFT_959049 [Dendrothele bispora CBS 962.96]|uniref:Uncharacterized protein n=1 Tax=Dendrothele bispora (strain CBS 962.96) TaxID=1314807 RepID=A0A4S8MYG8_DENBC|nr:hypothetical protein K435DRAFT_959049 [Dendrothele bispora CBS 962.96]